MCGDLCVMGNMKILVRELGFEERVGKQEKINMLRQNDADVCFCLLSLIFR